MTYDFFSCIELYKKLFYLVSRKMIQDQKLGQEAFLSFFLLAPPPPSSLWREPPITLLSFSVHHYPGFSQGFLKWVRIKAVACNCFTYQDRYLQEEVFPLQWEKEVKKVINCFSVVFWRGVGSLYHDILHQEWGKCSQEAVSKHPWY